MTRSSITVLGAPAARQRVLAMILHDKVRAEAVAIRQDANGTTHHADHGEGFTSSALDDLRRRRAEADPLHDCHCVEEVEAYDLLQERTDAQVETLIEVLTVELVTAHLQRATPLVFRLADELGVEFRRYWRPEARWLAGYKKIQLAGLIAELRGPVYPTAAGRRRKAIW